MESEAKIAAEIREAAESFAALAALGPEIARAGALLIGCIKSGGKVMFCGNGGSAADSQHLAAELAGRYLRERQPLAGLALTTDTSALTAIGNDYGFAEVFVRQLRAVGRPGDALVGLSTSGESANVLAALAAARDMGIATVGLTGAGGGAMTAACDICLRVPSRRTNRIQEMHIAVGHILCGLVEEACG